MRVLIAALLAVLISTSFVPEAVAAEMGDERLATILTRVLAFDRNLKSRSGHALKIGILTRPDAAAREEGGRLIAAFRGLQDMTVQGLRLEITAIEYEGQAALAAQLASTGVSTLYVARGLEEEVQKIGAVCRDRRVMSLASTPSYVQSGLSVGVFEENGKPKIHVNLVASRLEGIAFLPELLRLAKIVER